MPFLLIGAFKSIVEQLHTELADLGHPQARPIHGFALQALGEGGATIGELGRRLGVSKQAAAKTVRSLERAGYAMRRPDPDDGRAWVIERTREGAEMLATSAAVLCKLRSRWLERLGSQRVAELESDLAALAGDHAAATVSDLPGWLS